MKERFSMQEAPLADAVAIRVHELRRERRLSAEALAEKCGWTRSVVNNFELRRKKHISVDELAVLADVLGVTPADLCPTLAASPEDRIEVTDRQREALITAIRGQLRIVRRLD